MFRPQFVTNQFFLDSVFLEMQLAKQQGMQYKIPVLKFFSCTKVLKPKKTSIIKIFADFELRRFAQYFVNYQKNENRKVRNYTLSNLSNKHDVS